MKKRILAVLLAMVLVFAYAVPVAAAEKVSEDPQIQAAYEAYVELEAALAGSDYAALEPAYKSLEGLSFDTDAQQEEFDALVNEKIGLDKYLSTLFTAAYIVDAENKYEAFAADKSAKTAYDFVAAYDAVTADYEINMDAFVPGIAAAYGDAKANYMPNDNVVKVYDAYVALDAALEMLEAGFYDADFVNACKGFEAVLDIFNEMTQDEFADLAAMMGVADAEAVFGAVLADWINANLALELGALYDAYLSDPSEKTATEFVNKYEELQNDTQMLTDADKTVILTAFTDTYEDAKSFIEQAANVPSEDTAAEGTDKSDKDSSPKTGDESNMLVPFMVMIAAAGVAAATLRRRAQ